MSNKKQGFTLIELLVVIAIIGILASVVLASLNSARDKGANASAKASLTNARAQAELYYDNNSSSYSGVCTNATTGIQDMINAATNATGNTADCDDSQTAWAAEVQLKGTPTQYFCVDSTGAATTTTSSKGASATNC